MSPSGRIALLALVTAFAPLLGSNTARAESLLPIVTQEAQTLPNGRAEAIIYGGYFSGIWYPAFTKPGTVCCERLVTAPTFGFNIGLGDRVEVQASYGLVGLQETQFGIGQTNNYGTGDIRLFTKVAAFSEQGWRPAMGFLFGAKLGDASFEKHLGTHETDWTGEVLASKDLGVVKLDANLGLTLLSIPTEAGEDDLFDYAVGGSSQDLPQAIGPFAIRFVSEVAGATGSRFDNNRSAFRAGFQLRGESLTLFGGVSAGLIRESEDIGGIVGLMWRFTAFE